jgi:thiamine biosynthesis protein ThiS
VNGEGRVSEGQDAIRVRVNGEDRTVPRGLDVRSLLERLGVTPELVVVERNLEILGRDRYDSVIVEDGDALEVVHFVGGG